MSAKGKKRKQSPANRGGAVGYSVDTVASLLGISRASAYTAINKGEIPVVRIGHLLIIPRDRFHEKFGALMPDAEAPAAA